MKHALIYIIYNDGSWNFMILIKAERAYFNNLKAMFKANYRCSFYDIINIIIFFYNHENLKKAFLKFIYIINTENSTLLTNYY